MVEAAGGRKKADCLIVSANQVVTPYPVYPLGAACLVTALNEKGHIADHFDILADGGRDGLRQLLARRSYDLIGVSIRNLDTTDSSAPGDFLGDIVDTVACIRQIVSAPVVLGGPAFSIMPGELLHLLKADYGIIGEGEVLLPWLAGEIVEGKSPVKKLFYSEPSTGQWRPSDLTPSTSQYYIQHGGMLNVQTKRGCPYSCSYCSYPTIEGTQIRYRDPLEVADEVLHLRDHSGAKYIFFADSFFNDPGGRFLEVAEALIQKGNKVPWCAFFRPDDLRRSDLQLLKRAGLSAMELGTDATTDETLEGIGKSFHFSDVLRTNELIVKEEIPCAHYVMFGGPGENKSTLVKGLRNLEQLLGCLVFAFAGLRVLPDTGLFVQAVNDGVITAEQSLLEPTFYVSPSITLKEITERITESFDGRVDRVYPCHEFEQRIRMLHQMGHVGPLWDLLLKNAGDNS